MYAKKRSEAGDFYNQKTINFIYKIINSGTDIESFDPIECVKNYFSQISDKILESPIGEQELIFNQDEKNEGKNNANDIPKIMLKDPNKNICLKKCLIGELGIVQGNTMLKIVTILQKKMFLCMLNNLENTLIQKKMQNMKMLESKRNQKVAIIL